MKSSSIREELLLYRLRKKDRQAFAELYDAYVTPIYRYVYFKVTNRHDAEDITSEIFLKAWNYILETTSDIGNLRALLYKVARNVTIDFYRRRARSDMPHDDEQLLRIPDHRQQSLLVEAEARAEWQRIEPLLRKMKDEYREVLLLKYVEGLSTSEIARIMDKSSGAVRVLLHRALAVAQQLVQQNSTHDQV